MKESFSLDHKKKIAEAKALDHFVTEPTDDVDRKLFQIRQGLEFGLGRDFDFYDSDIISWWDAETSPPWWNPSTSNPWDKYLRLASDFLHSGRMRPWELKYKYEIGEKLAVGRKAVLNNAGNWQELVKRGITGNIIHPTQQDNIRRWIDESPGDALEAVSALWADDDSSLDERVQVFTEKYPRIVRSRTGGAGTRMNVVSQLLMGLDVEQCPPFRIEAFKDAYNRTGLPPAT